MVRGTNLKVGFLDLTNIFRNYLLLSPADEFLSILNCRNIPRIQYIHVNVIIMRQTE